jgi:hypothetical protein
MSNWIAGAMTVLGTLLVISGAGLIILRSWPRGTGTPAETTTEVSAAAPGNDLDRGARALRRLGPPDRLIGWGILLLILAALASGAIGFQIGSNMPTR